ncbi:hypothetical protein GCM10010433_03040 [Streptomyces pulveraceus]
MRGVRIVDRPIAAVRAKGRGGRGRYGIACGGGAGGSRRLATQGDASVTGMCGATMSRGILVTKSRRAPAGRGLS